MTSALDVPPNESSIRINSLLEYSVEEPQPKSPFRGLHKFMLRRLGKKFNPHPQPAFKISYSLNSDETTSVLPPEIWTDIFHRICDEVIDELISRYTAEVDQHHAPGYHPPDPAFTPVILSHVCRYWNVLITSNPTFWNRIFIRMRHKSLSPTKVLKLWLARSAPLPVSFYFNAILYYTRSKTTRDFSEPLIASIQVIHKHAHRFEHLSLKLCSRVIYIATWNATIKLGQRAKKPISLDFVSLESMDMATKEVMGGDNLVEAQEVAAAICGNRERVSRLRFGSYAFIHNIQSYNRHKIEIQLLTFMKNLTCLELCYTRIVTPIPTFLSHMSHIRNLSELWLVGTTFQDSDEGQWQFFQQGLHNIAPQKRTVLRSIEKLHLLVNTQLDYRIRVSDCVPFLAGVSLPNLTLLDVDESSIDAVRNGRPTRWSDRFNMLSESKCILRSLKFKFKQSLGPEHPHWKFFQSETCSSLQELTIQPRNWNSQDVLYLLDGLQRSYRNKDPTSVESSHITPFVTPTLKRLTVLGCATEDEALVRLATSRMEGENSLLEYLYIEVEELHPEKHPKAIELFDDLYKRGKKAYLKKPSSLTACHYNFTFESWIIGLSFTPKPVLVPIA